MIFEIIVRLECNEGVRKASVVRIFPIDLRLCIIYNNIV